MKKSFLSAVFLIASCLLHPVSSSAQSPVNVTATVLDPSGIPYANATVSILLLPVGGATVGGNQILTTNNGLLDASGKLNVSMYKNSDISPGGSTWQFTICETPGIAPPLGTGGVCFTSTQTVSAAVSFSTQFNAAAKALTTIPIGGGSVTSVTGNFPISSSGGNTPAISCSTCVLGGSFGSGVVPVGNGGQNLTSANSLSYSAIPSQFNIGLGTGRDSQIFLYNNLNVATVFQAPAIGGATIIFPSGASGAANSLFQSDGATPQHASWTVNPSVTSLTATTVNAGNVSGSGNFCLVTNCSMTTPALGTPSAAVLTNATGLPAAGIVPGSNTQCLKTTGGVTAWGACASATIQVATKTPGCTTAAPPGSICSDTLTWPVAFADASYVAVCSGTNVPQGVPGINAVQTYTTTTIAVTTTNINQGNVAGQYATINCIGIHP